MLGNKSEQQNFRTYYLFLLLLVRKWNELFTSFMSKVTSLIFVPVSVFLYMFVPTSFYFVCMRTTYNVMYPVLQNLQKSDFSMYILQM